MFVPFLLQNNTGPSFFWEAVSGVGSLPLTFTRATTATITDFEGLIKSCLSGELRIQGARRVYNKLPASESFPNTTRATSTPNVVANPVDGAVTADLITEDSTAGATHEIGRYSGQITAGNAYVFRGVFKTNGRRYVQVRFAGDGAQAASIDLQTGAVSGGASIVNLGYKDYGNGWYLFTVGIDSAVASDSNFYVFMSNSGTPNTTSYNGDGASGVYAWGVALYDVTGQAIKLLPEYVSVGVLSSPFHGYFADGVKYFSYANGNSIAANIVTEAQGAAITGTIGYLAEGARTNLCLQSETFGTTWTPTRATVTANATAAPDGTTTADALVEDANNNTHFIQQNFSKSTSVLPYVFSPWLKQATRTWAWVQIDDGAGANYVRAFINLATGALGTVSSAGTWSGASAEVETGANGFYRVKLTGTSNASTGLTCYIGGSDADTSISYQGVNGNTAIYMWGGQLEQASFASSYQPTTTAAVARNADALTLPTAGIADGTVGTAFVEYTTYRTSDVGIPMIGSFASTYAVLVGSNGGNVVGINDQGVWKGSSSTFSTPQTTLNKIAATWGGSSASAASAGSASAISSFSGDLGLGTTLSIGMHGNALAQSQLYGVISKIKIYKQKMSNAQLQALTS